MKLNNTQKAIIKILDSDVKDQELQKRFNGFITSKARYEESCKSFAQEHGVLVGRQKIISGVILELLKAGQKISDEVVEELKQLDIKIKKTYENYQIVEKEKNYYDNLIKRYRDATDSKLFLYWKILKDTNTTTEIWLEWKKKYEDKIF